MTGSPSLSPAVMRKLEAHREKLANNIVVLSAARVGPERARQLIDALSTALADAKRPSSGSATDSQAGQASAVAKTLPANASTGAGILSGLLNIVTELCPGELSRMSALSIVESVVRLEVTPQHALSRSSSTKRPGEKKR